MEDASTCRNCGYQLKPIYKYCPECGQKAQDDLTLKVLFNNTISNYFSVDARFFKSFIPLIFRPGFLAKKFVEGKRLTYLHPAQFYLFISVVFFFILSFKVREYNAAADKAMKKGFEMEANINTEKKADSVANAILDSTDAARLKGPILNNPAVAINLSKEDRKLLDSTLTSEFSKTPENDFNLFGYDSKKLDSLSAINAPEKEKLAVMGIKEDAGFIQKTFGRQYLKFRERKGGGFVQAIFDTIPIALFLMLPVFAFILKIFYLFKGRFAHHLVFSFYYFSFLFIVLTILIGVNQFIWDIPGWLIWLVMLYIFMYLWLSLRHFYQQGYFLSLIKCGMVTFIYMLIILPFAVGLTVLASFIFY